VRPGAAFCDACGTSLTGAKKNRGIGEKREKHGRKEKNKLFQTPNPELPAAERRQLTVMFCDLVGSTALSEQLDPEEWRAVVQDYQRACAEVINRFDGHIAQYLGDGLLVYFGYPTAHEDDAARAVRAGLEIVEALQKWVPSPPVEQASSLLAARMAAPLEGQGKEGVGARRHVPLQVRIGIHTGLVVVGEIGAGGKREQLALGDTPNLAARLQGLAEPDTVVISAATYRLIEGLLDCRNLGVRAVKGVSSPVQVYQVVGESDARSRLEVAATKGLTPFVGREEEVGLLHGRWEQSKKGTGQAVLLGGEAGIGKSRLVQILKEHIAEELHAQVEWRCSPYYQNSAFYPLIDHLQRALEFQRTDSPEEKLHKLEVGARHAVPLQRETLPLFASLLSLPLPDDRYPPLNLTPQRQKQKTLEALLAWLLKEAEQHPLLVVMEDLHWVDPSTLEFLGLLIDQIPTTRVLLLLTFRPDFSPPWTMLSHITQLTLSRLARRQVEAMVEKVTGGKTLPAEVIQQLVSKTDGVPLFVEELTKMVVESVGAHDGVPRPLAIPTTLHDSLMARLDRLPTAKGVAQLGATLGREFSYELIQAVSPMDEKPLQSALTKLVEAELLYQRRQPPQSRYIFKHALIQDAAYQSLLKSKRQQYHQQIVKVLEERFPETKETQPELLAYHYTEAGLVAQAIPYWQQAGQRASQRSAFVEAVAHLTKGLELLKALPDSPERAQRELTLQLALGAPLMTTKGYAAPEMEQAYTRARELCRQLGEPPQLFPVLFGLAAFRLTRGEVQTARELSEQLLRLAQSVQDTALLVAAHNALGETLYHLGEFVLAHKHLEQGIAVFDPQHHHSLVSGYGADQGEQCLCYAAYVLWHLGYPDQALKRIREALTLAQEFSHPYSLVYVLICTAFHHQFCREGQFAREHAEEVITLCTEQGFPWFLALGTIVRGWALSEQGQAEEGIAQMQQGLAACRATGAEVSQPHGLALLAEAYGKMGQVEEGLALLAEALDMADKTGERVNEAELYRLKGELTLKSRVQGSKSNVQEEAEGYFHKAGEVARRQQAKSLELRAAMSLARLWQQQGKKDEARQMLADIYGWFTEGFDTADLKEAKALLDSLASRV
jgi:TOMM system kinase/cyclase fusion protein